MNIINLYTKAYSTSDTELVDLNKFIIKGINTNLLLVSSILLIPTAPKLSLCNSDNYRGIYLFM